MILEWKWKRVTKNFVLGLSLTLRKKNVIWVILDQLMKLYSVPLSIISDCDLIFTSRFWSKLHEALGTKLKFSTTFHPQMDDQSE
ncbi:DNA/RNA polymerases superfamily protein [Gossypium australe]|uniref:DNA/RNA polymerases superfamily protein n=1 Tax=Gossypium australe TaxID=47621 RepID=A0A5B6WQ27_9ROSI|nr:DNA/RNA polymerases superfamily protein [Gossypium australe]